MLTIENLLRHVRRIPALLLIGVALMAVGGAADVVAHLVVPADAHYAHRVMGGDPTGHVAHLIGLAGMVLVLAGVVMHGVRSTRRRPAASNGGSDSDAHR